MKLHLILGKKDGVWLEYTAEAESHIQAKMIGLRYGLTNITTKVIHRPELIDGCVSDEIITELKKVDLFKYLQSNNCTHEADFEFKNLVLDIKFKVTNRMIDSVYMEVWKNIEGNFRTAFLTDLEHAKVVSYLKNIIIPLEEDIKSDSYESTGHKLEDFI